jgi:lycopene cyclase domain-containing protein
MFKYSLLILLCFVISFFIALIYKLKPKFTKANNYTILVALASMLIFDTYLTALPIVMYNVNLTLKLNIFTFPIEDIGYLIVATILLPLLFEKLSNEKRISKNRKTKP